MGKIKSPVKASRQKRKRIPRKKGKRKSRKLKKEHPYYIFDNDPLA